MNRKVAAVLALPAFALLCSASLAGGQGAESVQKHSGQEAVEVTITARSTSKSPSPALTARDVTVHENKKPQPVIALVHATGSESSLQFAILIDSSSSVRIGSQFSDILNFLQSLPPEASVELAYAMNGVARIERPFTTDRAALNKALHTPFGPATGNTAIYAAVSDLISKWPAPTSGTRRELLLISSGIDMSYGFHETQPSQNPGLQSAIRDAQKSNITIFSIFVTSGRETRNQFLNLNGQGSLNLLTSDTGGYSFSQGTRMPVSFAPFLDQIQKMLSQQYVLTFRPAPTSSAGFHDFKVSTETAGVKLMAPRQVYVPASQ